MGKRSPRVDEYIAKAADFAKPILEHVRELVHKACPEVEETIKWGMPSFEYKGPFFGIASFKEHCSIGFWKASLLKDPKHYLSPRANQGGEAMGNFGKIKSLKDLPPNAAIIDFIKQAKKLNDDGVKLLRVKKKSTPLVVPTYILTAIKSNKKALATFNAFSPSNKKEYITWVTEAKTEPTREKRLKTAIQWMAEGKIRNWKYLKK
ncbi:MAG TPA: DUF1801 domain-containing protein [Cyclobacteriaceae bacterium]|nr:DUF1801 domain-containing protein [Cyclobacteriaceae bacterium]